MERRYLVVVCLVLVFEVIIFCFMFFSVNASVNDIFLIYECKLVFVFGSLKFLIEIYFMC